MNTNLHQAQSHSLLRSWQSKRTDINHPNDFVLPMFIGNDDNSLEPIESMPNVYRYGCNRAIEYLEPLVNSYGLKSVLLFPVVTKKDQVLDDESDDPQSDVDECENVTEKSSSSSESQYSRTSSDEEDGRTANIRPDRFIEIEPKVQNPFLNQNEEEEHHLLDEASGQEPGSDTVVPRPKVPTPPPRANEIALRKVSRKTDVRLIKDLALKDQHNPVLRLIPRLRAKFPNLLIICDVCLCAFTSTGHCCLFEDHLKAEKDRSGYRRTPNTMPSHAFPISNKITCQYLAILSVEYGLRGCNMVAPSDMMDGRILTIREKLNENRLQHVSIMSYSAKFASAFYGPFRQATNNAPEFGDRRAYQLPPGSRGLAMKAAERDISQGADFVMVKPGGPYLDIVRDIREAHPNIPIAIYQVSGEYAMLKAAASANIIDLKRSVSEMLTAFRRAGASIIISYFTPDILRGELNYVDN